MSERGGLVTDIDGVTTGSGGASLPEGRTCSECRSFSRCTWLSSCKPDGRECDWDPSRFVAATDVERVDTLEGQALEDAFAQEVMGWELSSGGFYWEGTLEWPPGKLRRVRQAHRKSWHPTSSWQSFGHRVDDMCERGFTVWMHTDGQLSECSVWATNGFGGKDPLVRQLGGKNLRETGLRAFVKAIRVKGATHA